MRRTGVWLTQQSDVVSATWHVTELIEADEMGAISAELTIHSHLTDASNGANWARA